MACLADWRDAQRIWEEYRRTRDLQTLREELLTSPTFAHDLGEQEVLFCLAATERDVRAAELMVELDVIDVRKLAPDGYHYLHWIIDECDDDPIMVRFLIDRGADLHQDGANDWTPLHVAAIRGKARIAEFLLDRGADINARTRIDGRLTPLMEAAWAGQLELVRLLLERGADRSLTTDWGDTAADRADHNGQKETARFLREWSMR